MEPLKNKIRKLRSKSPGPKPRSRSTSTPSNNNTNNRIPRDSGTSQSSIFEANNEQSNNNNHSLKAEILEAKKEMVVLCMSTVLQSMINEKRRFCDRFVNKELLVAQQQQAGNNKNDIPIKTDINVTSLNNIEYILYINNPEAADFQMYTSASHPNNVPHSHAQYQLKNLNNRKAKDRWQFLLDRESYSLSPALTLDWLYGAVKATLQVIKAKYDWMSDVSLMQNSKMNGRIVLNVGKSVISKYLEMKSHQVSSNNHQNLNHEIITNYLQKSSNCLCQVQINVCIPVTRSAEEISKLPEIAKEDVRNDNLFWILQSSSPLKNLFLDTNSSNYETEPPSNFWKIRVFARTPGNLCRGIFTTDKKSSEKIKMVFDNVKRLLHSLEHQSNLSNSTQKLYQNVSPMQIALSTILWHVDARTESFYQNNSVEEILLDVISNSLYKSFETMILPDRFLPEMNLLLPLVQNVSVNKIQILQVLKDYQNDLQNHRNRERSRNNSEMSKMSQISQISSEIASLHGSKVKLLSKTSSSTTTESFTNAESTLKNQLPSVSSNGNSRRPKILKKMRSQNSGHNSDHNKQVANSKSMVDIPNVYQQLNYNKQTSDPISKAQKPPLPMGLSKQKSILEIYKNHQIQKPPSQKPNPYENFRRTHTMHLQNIRHSSNSNSLSNDSPSLVNSDKTDKDTFSRYTIIQPTGIQMSRKTSSTVAQVGTFENSNLANRMIELSLSRGRNSRSSRSSEENEHNNNNRPTCKDRDSGLAEDLEVPLNMSRNSSGNNLLAAKQTRIESFVLPKPIPRIPKKSSPVSDEKMQIEKEIVEAVTDAYNKQTSLVSTLVRKLEANNINQAFEMSDESTLPKSPPKMALPSPPSQNNNFEKTKPNNFGFTKIIYGGKTLGQNQTVQYRNNNFSRNNRNNHQNNKEWRKSEYHERPNQIHSQNKGWELYV